MTDSIQTPTEEATTEAYVEDFAVIREHVFAGTADQLNLDPYDAEWIARAYKTLDEQMEIANSDQRIEKRRLAQSPLLMPEVAWVLAKDANAAQYVAGNEFATADILEDIANNPTLDYIAKQAVAVNEKAKFSTLMKLVFHPDHEVRNAVISSKQWKANCTPN